MEHLEDTKKPENQTGGDSQGPEEKDSESERSVDSRWKDAEETAASLGVEGVERLWNEHRKERELLSDSQENMKDVVESERERLEEVREYIQELTQEMDQKRSSIMSRILNWSRIRSLREELGTQFATARVLDESIQDKERITRYFNELLSTEKSYGAYLNQLEQETKDRELREFMEDEEKRKVESLVEKHNVYMVHKLVAGDWKPSKNNEAVNTRNLSAGDQLDIVTGLAPSLSVSTLHPNTEEGLFADTLSKGGGFGILLSEGRVQSGSPSDAGSVAVGRGEREQVGAKRTIEDIDKAIRKEFTSDRPSYETNRGYNELVVQNPKVAGLTFEWLEGDGNMSALKEGEENMLLDGNDVGYGVWWRLIGNMQQRGLPIFILDRTNNTVREVFDLDTEKRSFRVGPIVEPKELTQLSDEYKEHLSPEVRRRAVARVFDHVSGILTNDEKELYDPSSVPGGGGLKENWNVQELFKEEQLKAKKEKKKEWHPYMGVPPPLPDDEIRKSREVTPPPLPKEEWDPNGSVPPPLS
jgi:hypothetical protein